MPSMGSLSVTEECDPRSTNSAHRVHSISEKNQVILQKAGHIGQILIVSENAQLKKHIGHAQYCFKSFQYA
jgi:hypothetical protein